MGHIVPADQYAFRRAKSSEGPSSDLDHSAASNGTREETVYVVGLDIAGAFNGAMRQEIIDALSFA